MRAVITGHTSGLGKAVAEQLAALNVEVVGASRSNGFDLWTQQHLVIDLLRKVKPDLFINNAHVAFKQVELAFAWCELFGDDSTKTMVTVGSLITTVNRYPKPCQYEIEKLALDETVKHLRRFSEAKLVHVRFGPLALGRGLLSEGGKLPLSDAAKALITAANGSTLDQLIVKR